MASSWAGSSAFFAVVDAPGSGTRRCSHGLRRALRRSELVALDTADVIKKRQGLVATSDDPRPTRRQWGAGWCPPTARIQRRTQHGPWRTGAKPRDEGTLFLIFDRRGRLTQNRLHASAVLRIVRRAVAATGIDLMREVRNARVLGTAVVSAIEAVITSPPAAGACGRRRSEGARSGPPGL